MELPLGKRYELFRESGGYRKFVKEHPSCDRALRITHQNGKYYFRKLVFYAIDRDEFLRRLDGFEIPAYYKKFSFVVCVWDAIEKNKNSEEEVVVPFRYIYLT